MFLTEAFNVDPVGELDFTTELLYSNFSNYSAWHHRCRLLLILKASKYELYRDTLEADLELCKSAIFTQPSDQSVWFYANWLAKESALIKESLVNACKELEALEPDKHPLVVLFLAENTENGANQYYDTLARIDPMRAGLYSRMKNMQKDL